VFCRRFSGFALDLSLSRDVLTQARGSAEAAVPPLGPRQRGTLPRGLVTPAGYYSSGWWQYGGTAAGSYYGGGCHVVKQYYKRRGYYY